jgi:hypothetical protein
MHSMPQPTVPLIATLLFAAAAPVTAQDKAPLFVYETRLPDHRGITFWAQNKSRDTVWVDSLLIHSCDNVRLADCRGHAVVAAIAPDSTVAIFILHPIVIGRALNYRWSYTWHVVTIDSLCDRARRR